MARKAANQAQQPPIDGESEEVVVAELPEDEGGEDDALAELRGLGAGGDHRFTVSRVSTEPGRKAGYCKTYTVGDLSLDTIRDEFGGGKFKIRVIDSAGKYVSQTTVDIVDLPKPAAAAAAVTAPGADLAGIAALLAAVKPGDGAGGIAQIMTMMMAQQKATTDMIVGLMNRPVPQGPSITDILSIMNANKTEKTDPVALLLQGLELGKTLAGGGDDGGGMLGVAKQGLELITPLVQQGMEDRRAAIAANPRRLSAPKATAEVTPTATGVAPVASNVETAGAQPVNVLKQLQWIKAQLNMLVQHASRDKDPELYAEVMLDNLPDFISVEDIEKHIGATDAVAQLARIDSRVTQFAPWFEKFREAVKTFIADEGGEESEEAEGDELDDAPGESP